MARDQSRNVTRQVSMTSSVMEQPMSRSRTNRRDLASSVEVYRKVAGTSKAGRGCPRSHNRGMSVERNTEVTLSRGMSEKLGCSLEKMRVTNVQNGSVADRHGLNGYVGRTITHVNNQPVHSIDDIKQLTSASNSVTLRFKDPTQHRGRRSVSYRLNDKESDAVSCRRHIRSPYADELKDIFAEQAPIQQTTQRSASCGIYVPYGDSTNEPVAFPGTVPVLTVPGHAPRISKNGQVSQSLGRFRFPPNLSCEQMECYGLSSGGNKLVNYRPPSPNKKGGGVSRQSRRAHSEPRGSMNALISHSSRNDRSFVHVSPSRRAGLHLLTNQSPKLDFLHHDDGLTVPWSPSEKFNNLSPRPGSPSRRRAIDHRSFNPTFLSDGPTTPRGGRSGRGRESIPRDHGDLVGNTHLGNLKNLTPVNSVRTAVSKCILPKVVNKYQGPTKKHPISTPMTSDIFNSNMYTPYSCQDMRDSASTRIKGRVNTFRSPMSLTHNEPMADPRTPQSPGASRRRAHTPAPSPRPPWDTHN